MKKMLLIAGLVLQLAAIITAVALSNASGYHSWTCYENTANEDALMDCSMSDTPQFSSSTMPAIPITVGLLGLGLVVASVAVGQGSSPKDASRPQIQPQPHQPQPQQPTPPAAQPPQQHPQAPQQPNVPHSGQQISYQYGQPGQPPQYPPGQSPES